MTAKGAGTQTEFVLCLTYEIFEQIHNSSSWIQGRVALNGPGGNRAETTYHSNGNFAGGPTAGDLNNRTTSEFVMRARAYITADSREQTALGTARTYFAVGIADTDTGPAIAFSPLFINRAFFQWAGITAGITQSFFDFYSSRNIASYQTCCYPRLPSCRPQ